MILLATIKKIRMKKKVYLLLILVFISQIIHSQKTEIPEKEKNLFYSFVFEKTKKLFKKPEYNFKSQKLELDRKFIKSNKPEDSIISSIKYFEKNSKLEIKNNSIMLISNFPDNFISEDLDVISIKLEENKLFGNNNTPLKITKSESTTFGKNINKSNFLSFDSKFDENLKGEVSYRIKFITDYSFKKISKKDIGKTIKLSKNHYEIIDIFENKIILKSNLSDKSTIRDLEIKCISLDKNGEMELISEIPSISSSLINQEIYHLLKKDKDLSIDIYKNKIPFEELMDDSLLGKYIILERPAPIDNEIILYQPIYGVNKIIKVKL